MKNKLFKTIGITLTFIFILAVIIIAITKQAQNKKPADIISTNFIGYDFARAVTGDDSKVAMLLKPGAEMHDFEPTPEDIINIKNADLFIYVGGESEKWVENLLNSNEIPKEKTLRLMDLVEVKEESLPSGATKQNHEDNSYHSTAEDEVEYDEHIWTSPINAIELVKGTERKLSNLHPEKAAIYSQNATAYISRLSDIDQKFRDLVSSSNRKELIFGDRFPFRYFADEYGLTYHAAFPGCSEQTEASSQTIAFLINQAKSSGIKTILKIELTSDSLAKTIAEEVGAKVLTMHSAHNISNVDFEKGTTYADIMEGNIEVLKEALN